MNGNRWKLFFSLVLFFELIKGVSAMELNLNLPWGIKMSPPSVLELQFSSPQSDDMIFGEVKEVEIRCRAGVHSVGLKYAVSRNCMSTPFIQGDAAALPANTYVIKAPTEKLFPGFYDVKNAALKNGALGCSISGAGPSIFAVAESPANARKIGRAMQTAFKRREIKSSLLISEVDEKGSRKV